MSSQGGQIPIPSDMPISPLSAPGQPLPHRFVPSQTQTPAAKPPNLASNLGFQPLTTISLPEQNIFVRPVNNIRSRPVSPFLKGKVKLPIRGEHVIEFGDSLKTQIKERTEAASSFLKTEPQKPANKPVLTPPNLTIPAVKPSSTPPQTAISTQPPAPGPNQSPTANPQAPVSPGQASNDYNQKVKAQLAEINQMLYEQIKLKVAEELRRQKANITTRQSVAMSNPPKPLDHLPPGKLNRPLSPGSTSTTLTRPSKPTSTLNQPKPLVKPSSGVASQPPLVPTVPPIDHKLPPEVSNEQKHIETLENEVRLLSKEIRQLEEVIKHSQTEETGELQDLESKVKVDERMLKAVADWRGSLDNLVNSHVTALKYLKAKTDWLEDKTERKGTHHDKHEKLHRKPKEIRLNLHRYQPGFSELDTLSSATEPLLEKPLVGTPPKEVTQPTIQIGPVKTEAEPLPKLEPKVAFSPNALPTGPVVGKVSVDSSEKTPTGPSLGTVGISPLAPTNQRPVGTLGLNANQAQGQNLGQIGVEDKAPEKVIEQQTVVVKPESPKTEVVSKPTITATPEEAEKMETEPGKSSLGPVVEQQTIMVKPEQATVVEPERKVKEVQTPSFEAVRDLVKQALEKEKQSQDQKFSQEDVSRLVKQAVSEANNIRPETPKLATEGKEGEKTTSLSGKTPVNIVIQRSEPSSNDIERQILESAAKEEAAKEAVRLAKEKAHRESEEKRKKLEEQAKGPVSPTSAPTSALPSVDNQNLEEQFKLLKDRIAQDQAAAAGINQKERDEMISKLKKLEGEALVSKQLDEIKSTAERRRINQEVRALLDQVNQKKEVVEDLSRSEKIETLKVEQKKRATPAEKAQVIAEIKQLERESQARKAAEAARPHIKAQLAYGKMLPNTPTIPNVINGIVRDNKGLLLSTVVIIVKDTRGDPVRAFKTNKIGQFALSTPLPNGTYVLELEKEGYDFDIIEVDVDGSILRPIEIKAK